MPAPLPKSAKDARFDLRAMAVLWLGLWTMGAVITCREGIDAVSLCMLVYFGYIGVGCLVTGSLISRGHPSWKTAAWAVLPFCMVLFPVGPLVAIHAALKLQNPEMKEFYEQCRRTKLEATQPAQGNPE
jgi:threonine/homoserine efflux transporter RhtA